jgi:hypothetical protein
LRCWPIAVDTSAATASLSDIHALTIEAAGLRFDPRHRLSPYSIWGKKLVATSNDERTMAEAVPTNLWILASKFVENDR